MVQYLFYVEINSIKLYTFWDYSLNLAHKFFLHFIFFNVSILVSYQSVDEKIGSIIKGLEGLRLLTTFLQSGLDVAKTNNGAMTVVKSEASWNLQCHLENILWFFISEEKVTVISYHFTRYENVIVVKSGDTSNLQ